MYLTQHIQLMCSVAAVGVALLAVGVPYARAIRQSQMDAAVSAATTNEHLAALNGSVARHEEALLEVQQARIEFLRNPPWVPQWEGFREEIREDFDSAIAKMNEAHWKAQGAGGQ